jgi:hypothetical protein
MRIGVLADGYGIVAVAFVWECAFDIARIDGDGNVVVSGGGLTARVGIARPDSKTHIISALSTVRPTAFQR